MTDYRPLIEVAELRDIAARADCRIVDCRFDLMKPEKGRAEYLAGHIPGAVYADLDKDLAGPVSDTTGRHPLPEAEVFATTLRRLGIAADTQVVVYDYASGALAARMWWMLRWVGHARVAVLNGGLKAWLAADGPLQTEVPVYAETELEVVPECGRIASTADISAALREGRALRLVDARDGPRFAGHTEPIDAIAGHVPGAVNLPFSDNLDDDGTWKSADELRRLWAGIPGNESPAPFIVMCGSGVTACHLALSAEIAGLRGPQVYIGSWSEWIRDPSRPVATAE